MAANHAGRSNTSEFADCQFQTSTKVKKLKSLMTNDKPDSNKGLQLFFFDVDVRPQSAQEVRMVTVGGQRGGKCEINHLDIFSFSHNQIARCSRLSIPKIV